MSHLFQGRKAVLATRHEKERVIAPIMLKECGVEVVVPDDFDTDQFGTFTRDIQRQGSQLEAARKKALTAMKQYGFDLGIASEGSFGADPHIPFIQTNTEVVILIDTKNNFEIVGYYRSPHIKVFERYVSSPPIS